MSPMGNRSEALAAQLDQAVADLLAAVEASTPEQWSAKCSDGEWTQGFAAYHAATNIEPIARTIHGVAGGQQFPDMTFELIDQINAEQWKEHVGSTKAETAEIIRNSAGSASQLMRSLTDEQLDRKVQPPAGMPETTVEAIVQMAVIGHVGYHLSTITGAR